MLRPNKNEPIPPVMVQLFDGEVISQYNVVSARGRREITQLITRLADAASAEFSLAA